MKNKNKYLGLIVVSLFTVIALPIFLCNTVGHASIETTSEKDKGNISDDMLSKYPYKVEINDPKKVDEIVSAYHLEGDVEEIIYVPIADITADQHGIKYLFPAGAGYSVKKISDSEQRGAKLRSSWYEYPGGTMTISENLSISNSFSAQGGVTVGADDLNAALTAAYGFNVTKGRTISDSQNVSVKKGCKRNVKAYRNNRVYNYRLYKKKLIGGTEYCGKGEIRKPIGIIFTISENVKK